MTAHPLLHSFADPAKAEHDFIEIVSGRGAIVTDADGRDYIDAIASLWYCQIGHGRTEIRDAITTQLDKIAAYNVFDPFTNGPARRVAEMVSELSPIPDGRVFLATSGSEAIDTALKLARMTHRLRGEPDRQIVITRSSGYHGTNFGGTTAQGIAANRQGWGDLVPHFVEVRGDDVEALSSVFSEHGERIAAVLTEPVQGAGGVLLPPDGYLDEARRLCDRHGALLVFDEVICGFGRTGNWFGAHTYGVVPDLITFAKGVTSGYLPLSGVIVSRAVAETIESADALLRTGYTYAGHPTCAAAAIRNIEIIRDEGLCRRAVEIGDRLAAGLRAIVADGSAESFRGVGAIWAIEVDEVMLVRDRLREHGVIVRAMSSAIAMCPPLVITDEQVDDVIDALDRVLTTG
jgi:adenosylmethionine-8-amino-7-oxononanoate aminotransferase